MENWTEIRSAYWVAKLGTVSAAAEQLGVHRATINRHIETLEETLSTNLFQRHARGFTMTEAGHDLLDTAQRADEMFSDLFGRTQGRQARLSGELIISTLSGLSPIIMPAIAEFSMAYPDVNLVYLTGGQLALLEHGEAHIAIRAGQKPEVPDYVVLPFKDLHFSLYAHRGYIERMGEMMHVTEASRHSFVGSLNTQGKAPMAQWLASFVPAENLVLQVQDLRSNLAAIDAGVGMGILADHEAQPFADLVPVLAEQTAWSIKLWLVTHVDLQRTSKVQAFISCLRDVV